MAVRYVPTIQLWNTDDADLYMKTRLNLRHPRPIFSIETGNGLSKKIKQK